MSVEATDRDRRPMAPKRVRQGREDTSPLPKGSFGTG